VAGQDALQPTLDKHAITEVLVRYWAGIDREEGELIKSVHHEDATDDHGIWKEPGVDFASWLVPKLAQIPCRHSITNVCIHLQGDVAFSDAHCLAVTGNGAVKDRANDECDLSVFCRFVDRFERRGGESKIADRKRVFDLARRRGATVESIFPGALLTLGVKRTGRRFLCRMTNKRRIELVLGRPRAVRRSRAGCGWGVLSSSETKQ